MGHASAQGKSGVGWARRERAAFPLPSPHGARCSAQGESGIDPWRNASGRPQKRLRRLRRLRLSELRSRPWQRLISAQMRQAGAMTSTGSNGATRWPHVYPYGELPVAEFTACPDPCRLAGQARNPPPGAINRAHAAKAREPEGNPPSRQSRKSCPRPAPAAITSHAQGNPAALRRWRWFSSTPPTTKCWGMGEVDLERQSGPSSPEGGQGTSHPLSRARRNLEPNRWERTFHRQGRKLSTMAMSCCFAA